ncbi:uncharacterized protein LOC100577829 isoform X2 [Apis mellifera]|uniref:Uncharacterized protein LOC100577829 isoform X2 n=1 Tax=Apis mellifera TaxID=7460 RepID=A0A7M7GB10_APIME|nr:uncharacterized protein LOC100577829 isoform X2 [Apis mellifera]|eukprot:XP_003250961.2 uncharacterized protein LOC100577829 isoform X2 [Apis mellifera]
MDIFTRNWFLLALFVLPLEIIEMGNGYKLIRPYKYYQPRPLRWSGWWHADHKSSKFYRSKRISPEDYYSRRPIYNSYELARDDFDGRIENYPCIIVIQLSKGRYEDEDDKRNKKYERIPIHGENNYVEDNDESKMRNVQIQMVKSENPKLHIKISRSDSEKDIKIMDKLNITVRDQYY